MLTAEGCLARRQRLWDSLPEPCDVLVLSDPHHLIYFANYAQSPFVFRSVDAGALLVLEPGKATLVTDNLTQPFWAKAAVDEVVAPVWYEGKRSAPHRQALRARAARELVARHAGARVGIESASVPYAAVEGLESRKDGGAPFVDLDPVIRALRRVKHADEIELLRRAIRAGEGGMGVALERVRPGMTELDAFLIVQNVAMEELGEQAIVYGDFASGTRCETERGGPPTHRRIGRGELLLLDFSVVVFGYRGDFTNTFVVGDEPSPRQQEMYEACLAALEAGESKLLPGTPARDVDAAVRAHFASVGLESAFLSHSGHGLGLGHPEPPYFVPESDDILFAGDVVAVEPGLYIEGVGGMRFERNYLVTPAGPELLSHHKLVLRQ
jgi:Xaa-Pro aminopeptidase